MTTEDTSEHHGHGVPPRHKVLHYHGDEVRVLFFVSALVLLVAQSTGVDLHLSTFTAVAMAIILVVAAGITNPAQYRIHWFNALLSVTGVLFFGTSAVDSYRIGASIFDPSFVYIEALALLSLVALYFTTRTVRGNILRPRLQ
ncbi:MAG: hypothetical protein ACHQU0_03010 [Candidatus Paceibacteria bacterium]